MKNILMASPRFYVWYVGGGRYLSSAEKKLEILVTSSRAEVTNSFHL